MANRIIAFSDSTSAPSWTHRHILHYPRPGTGMPEIIHNEQSQCADELSIALGYINLVVGIVPHSLEDRFRLL